MIVERCFTCDVNITGKREEHYACDCAANKLDEEEQELVGALMLLDFCDHFCCGLPPNACHARSLRHWLKDHGWTKTSQ